MLRKVFNSRFILGSILLIYLTYAEASNELMNIQGTWEYLSCSYKNTSISGTLMINKDTMKYAGHQKEDYITQPSTGEYHYTLNSNRIALILTEGQKPPPIAEFVFQDGDYLYFSKHEINEIKEPDPRFGASWPYYGVNWVYKLQRKNTD